MRALCKLSFEGFSRFLMDKDNYAFTNEHAKHDTEVTIVSVSNTAEIFLLNLVIFIKTYSHGATAAELFPVSTLSLISILR